ncbi:MAG: urea ABC transporter ATP-binding protein UrtD [Nitrospirae bacterium]|nr:urea ABC transporter ATP-binding protein UrtD [Nitrospirota bacterium]
MAGTIVYMEDVTVDFSGFKALNRVNFFIDKGELRFLIGPNGAGKTTLLDVICGKVRPEKGRVVFGDDTDILRLSEHRIARCGISRKFQTPSIFANLTVFENMELSLKRKRGIFSSLFYTMNSKDMHKIFSTFEVVGLKGEAHQKAGSLSHGQKQWLELAMTIIQEPMLLLVDEPVAGMTGKERSRTGEILMEIAKEKSVLVVEHDMNFVRHFARKVTVLHEGGILCEGTFEHVKNDPVVIDVYLGRGGEEKEDALS